MAEERVDQAMAGRSEGDDVAHVLQAEVTRVDGLVLDGVPDHERAVFGLRLGAGAAFDAHAHEQLFGLGEPEQGEGRAIGQQVAVAAGGERLGIEPGEGAAPGAVVGQVADPHLLVDRGAVGLGQGGDDGHADRADADFVEAADVARVAVGVGAEPPRALRIVEGDVRVRVGTEAHGAVAEIADGVSLAEHEAAAAEVDHAGAVGRAAENMLGEEARAVDVVVQAAVEDEEVRAVAVPVEVDEARGDRRVGTGDADAAERAGAAFIAVIPRGDAAVGHGQGVAERHDLVAGRMEGRERRRQVGHGLKLVAADAEFAGVGLDVEHAVDALVEEQLLGVVLRIDHGAEGFFCAGLRIDDEEVGMNDLGQGDERAVGAGDGVEVFVGVIHGPEARELAGGGLEARERAVGIGADPEGAVGGFRDAGRERGFLAVNHAEVLESALGPGGIVAEEVAGEVFADVEGAGARTAEGGGGVLHAAGRGVELPAVPGGEVDIDDEEPAVVLAHGGEEGRLAVGSAAGVQAHPVDGFDRHAEVAHDDFSGRGGGGGRHGGSGDEQGGEQGGQFHSGSSSTRSRQPVAK